MLLRHQRKFGPEPASSEITPETAFRTAGESRRRCLPGVASVGACAALGAVAARRFPSLLHPGTVEAAEAPLKTVPGKYSTAEAETPEAKATTYNNFNEFGTDKSTRSITRTPCRHGPGRCR